MENEQDSAEPAPEGKTRLVQASFPVPLLREMDTLCDFNRINRSEFIIFAALQLIDYLDRKIGPASTEEIWDEDDSYSDEEDDFLAAAEEDDEE